MRLSEQLEPVISDLLAKNGGTRTALRGGAFCASIERPPDGEPWVQVKTGVLNVFYPSDEPPLGAREPRDAAKRDFLPGVGALEVRDPGVRTHGRSGHR